MRFVFPVLISVMIAMLFVSFYARLPPQLPFSISESDLPKPSRSNPIQVLSTLPAPDVTPEPALAAVAATPAPASDNTPEPALAPVAATPAPAPDETPEPALTAAPKVPKVKPAADSARAEAPPKKKRVIASGAASATIDREPARPRGRDFGQAAGESPPQ